MATNLDIVVSNNTLHSIELAKVIDVISVESELKIVLVLNDTSRVVLQFVDNTEFSNSLLTIKWLLADYQNRNLPDPNATTPPYGQISINTHIVQILPYDVKTLSVENTVPNVVGNIDPTDNNRFVIDDGFASLNGDLFKKRDLYRPTKF